MRDFTGKVALVTGGSRGIGAAVVKQFASQGADVAVVYAGNQELAEALCAQCAADYGVKAIAYRCDVADFAAVKDTVNQVKKDFGSVDILVNNAGITQDGLLAMMKQEAFDRVLDVDLKGAFHFIRHCTGLFLRKKAGAIINVASVSGLIGNAGQANYSAAKAGLIGLTKAVAKELAPKGITCNAVAPGFVATDMTKDLEGQDNALLSAIPLGRMGQPEEVAEAVAFLAQSPYITGEVLRVIRELKDAGRTMILVTHEMGFARSAADKVIFMADGVIEEYGTPEEVFGSPRSEKTISFLEKSLENIT